LDAACQDLDRHNGGGVVEATQPVLRLARGGDDADEDGAAQLAGQAQEVVEIDVAVHVVEVGDKRAVRGEGEWRPVDGVRHGWPV
jgi:hypothetical protein